MELITLYKGDEKAHVEKGSQGEAEMKAAGFVLRRPEKAKPKTKPKAKVK